PPMPNPKYLGPIEAVSAGSAAFASCSITAWGSVPPSGRGPPRAARNPARSTEGATDRSPACSRKSATRSAVARRTSRSPDTRCIIDEVFLRHVPSVDRIPPPGIDGGSRPSIGRRPSTEVPAPGDDLTTSSPPQRRESIAHALHSGAVASGGRFEADAIVANRELKPAVPLGDGHGRLFGTSVFRNVLQRLQGAEVHGRL